MKLANIYANVNGSLRGQGAVGESDSSCLDVRAVTEDGLLRDIRQVVRIDGDGGKTVISRRLEKVFAEGFPYVPGPLTLTPGADFNTAASGSASFSLTLSFRVSSLPCLLASNLSPSGASGWKMEVNAAGNPVYTALYSGSGTPAVFSSFTLSPGVWYTLELTGHTGGAAALSGRAYPYGTTPPAFQSGRSAHVSSFSNTRSVTFGAVGVDFRDVVALSGVRYGSESTQRRFSFTLDETTPGLALQVNIDGCDLRGGEVQSSEISSVRWVE